MIVETPYQSPLAVGPPVTLNDQKPLRYILVLALCSALPIAELVIGVQYENGNGCDNANLLRPVIYLIVAGSVMILILVMIFLYMFLDISDQSKNIIFIFVAILFPFYIWWSVIGTIVLWRDNIDCKPQTLHDMLWSSVIIRLVFIFIFIFHIYLIFNQFNTMLFQLTNNKYNNIF